MDNLLQGNTGRIDVGSLPPLVRRAVRRFHAAFQPECILIYGSFAKGNFQAGSDIDILIVAGQSVNPALQQRRARQLSSDCFPPLDVVFATPEEVKARDLAKTPFICTILEKAVVVDFT